MKEPITYPWIVRFVLVGLFFFQVTSIAGAEIRGVLSLESQLFPVSPLSDEQYEDGNLSLSVEPEFYVDWDGNNQSLTITPFLRLDQHDNKRTHFDLRELFWRITSDSWELVIGADKVFWGVTESYHLVNIINQTDFVEDFDQETKLGQPMVKLRLMQPWGTLDFFVLPYFRERTFPGKKGRLRPHPPVNTNDPLYDSDLKEWHTDWATRWSHYVGEFDIGISFFSGTNREPVLIPRITSAGDSELVPFYELINQVALDLQWTHNDWIWKLEAFNRSRCEDDFYACIFGLEYTVPRFLGSKADLGILSEYLYDDRGNTASTPFENDIFLGSRLAVNDVQNTELLIGVIFDADTQANKFLLEAGRRIGDSLKVSLDVQVFSDIEDTKPLGGFRRDDFLQITISRYF